MPATAKNMNKFMPKIDSLFYFFLLITILFCLQQATNAQFPLKIPKIKTEKPKTDQPRDDKTNPNSDLPRNPKQTNAQNGSANIYSNTLPNSTPVLLKNTVYVQAVTHNEYWKQPNVSNFSSWVPTIRFSHFFNNEKSLNYKVEFFNPDGSLWFSQNLEQSGSSAADRTVRFESPSPYGNVLDTKSSVGTGVYSFKITNVDTGEMLYQGKFKVGKFALSHRPAEKNKADFYVDHDWLLPFGMIGFHHSDIEIGGIPPEVSVWLKENASAEELEGRLFYKNQQIASTKDKIAGSNVTDYDERATKFAACCSPSNYWKRWQFQWGNFLFDNNGTFNRENYPNAFYADKNPGDYTVKIYRSGTQIREMNFTIGADGRFAVPAYTKDVYMPYHRIFLPVKIIGAEKWNPAAWKTDAFYGNPLSGFSAP